MIVCAEPGQHRAAAPHRPKVLVASACCSPRAAWPGSPASALHSSYAARHPAGRCCSSASAWARLAPAMNTGDLRRGAADAGVASAMVNTSQQVGGSIGTRCSTPWRPARPPATWPLTSAAGRRPQAGRGRADPAGPGAQLHDRILVGRRDIRRRRRPRCPAVPPRHTRRVRARRGHGGPAWRWCAVMTHTGIPTRARRTVTAFDPLAALDALLSDVGLSSAAAGRSISSAGQDPIVPAAHRLGACIGIPLMANAVAAVAFHRHRGGPAQDLELDLRQAGARHQPGRVLAPGPERPAGPASAGARQPVPAHPRTAPQTAAGSWHPGSTRTWPRSGAGSSTCRPTAPRSPPPSPAGMRSSLEQAANAAGLPACVVAIPPGMAGARARSAAGKPAGHRPAAHRRRPGTRLRPVAKAVRRRAVLSFTQAVAGPVVSRTLAEHGADVLCATRPNDYEHEFIYAEANVGSRSAYLDLASPAGQDAPPPCSQAPTS